MCHWTVDNDNDNVMPVCQLVVYTHVICSGNVMPVCQLFVCCNVMPVCQLYSIYVVYT